MEARKQAEHKFNRENEPKSPIQISGKGGFVWNWRHDSHLKQDMEVEKETQLEHTHHVNPPLLSAHRGRKILNAFCKQHNAKELHWQQKESGQGASGSGQCYLCGGGSAEPQMH